MYVYGWRLRDEAKLLTPLQTIEELTFQTSIETKHARTHKRTIVLRRSPRNDLFNCCRFLFSRVDSNSLMITARYAWFKTGIWLFPAIIAFISGFSIEVFPIQLQGSYQDFVKTRDDVQYYASSIMNFVDSAAAHCTVCIFSLWNIFLYKFTAARRKVVTSSIGCLT